MINPDPSRFRQDSEEDFPEPESDTVFFPPFNYCSTRKPESDMLLLLLLQLLQENQKTKLKNLKGS